MKEMTEQQALSALAALCSRSEHCTGDVLLKLERWGIDQDARQRIVDYLITNKYVDDLRYARLFVFDKLKFNKWGRRRIAEAMWAKRVPSDIQAEALSLLSDDDYADVLLPLLKSKARSVKASNDYERAMKLMKFAAGRGFDTSVIRRCLDEMGSLDECGYED